MTAALDLAAKAFGPVTVAVNCAGIAIASKTLGKAGALTCVKFCGDQTLNPKPTAHLPSVFWWFLRLLHAAHPSQALTIWMLSPESCT